MHEVTVLGSQSSIGSLRNIEELEQRSVKWRQGRGGTMACAGDLERDERDGLERFEEIVAGRASGDVASQQVGDLGDRTEGAPGGPFEQAEDHQRDAEDGDQA